MTKSHLDTRELTCLQRPGAGQYKGAVLWNLAVIVTIFMIVISIFDDDDDDDVLIMARLKYNGDDYFVGDDDHDHLIRDREVVEGEMRRRHCFLSLSGLW